LAPSLILGPGEREGIALPVTVRFADAAPLSTGDHLVGGQLDRPLAPEEMRPFLPGGAILPIHRRSPRCGPAVALTGLFASDGGMFATTHWSLVLAARGQPSPEARAALADLCRVYWYPLYAFIRRGGHGATAAEDLTQEFFARLLEKGWLGQADRTKGRFRSFLLAACKHFLANERARERALKRGGGRTHLPINFHDADARYAREPADALTPERLFERRWALALLDQVLAELRAEYAAASKEKLFDLLKARLGGAADAALYESVAAALGMTAGAVKVAAHRLRQRYRDRLREAIARTLDDPDAVDDEIRHLFAVLSA
jgi:RNA polymerase sigma-70 factor (ECF subfamily)